MIKKLLFISFLLIATIGFAQQKSISKLVTTPNPFTEKTTIHFNATSTQKITLSVSNILGKVVYKKIHKVKKGKNSIPFSRNNLQTGMYIYVLQNHKEIISKRFVIK
ncbi:putative secreted protein (Por secretion system target) [Lutibacter sp. Hel_I_33_5]|uniref:T9SS type A sorting domain-containing protein n=1 Tax=Lutibacter sp. Hel_I_33_5 TaxID=1566289 RepID=UPI0011A1E24D|nr:T9SS type A sorting domain-containing protein [Lutibacter sp. Hel_I_33_5]TVZ57176.1 putative secreted protein (Por secretion system target) [Lutibacter sp. Hel_I_33_5]